MSGGYLFDASAVVDVVIGPRPIGLVFDAVLLDLTVYEAANAIWKTGLAQDRLPDEQLTDAVDILSRLEQEVSLAPVSTLDLEQTMGVARDTELTYYDAVYLATATRESLSLVTEDEALREAALECGLTAPRLAELAANG